MQSLLDSVYSYFSPPQAEPPYEPDLLPQLPPEVILLILGHLLPQPSYTHALQRQTTLRRLSLVSRQFRSLAQPLLFKHPVIPDLEAAELFLAALEKREAVLGEDGTVSAAGDGVKAIRLGAKRGEPAWGDCTAVGELLRACGECEELWLLGMSTMHLEDLWEGKSLRTLHMQEVRITVGEREIAHFHASGSLPRLEHLSAKGTIFSGISLQSFLSPASLPALKSLDYLSIHQSLVPHGSSLVGSSQRFATALGSISARMGDETPFATVAEQLVHLRVGDYRTRSVAAGDIARCINLRSLDLPVLALPSLPLREHPGENEAGEVEHLPEEVIGAGLLPSSLRLLRLRAMPIEEEFMVARIYHVALARTGLLDIAFGREGDHAPMTVILPRAVGDAAPAAAREWVESSQVALRLRSKGIRLVPGQEEWLAALESDDAGFWLGMDELRGAVEYRFGQLET